MKKVASPSCPFCPSECQTLWHLFINCTHASSFWNRFHQWYSISSNTKLLLSELEVMFGIIRCHTYCLALNHLVILGKYFLYVNALNTIRYCFDDFVSLVRNKIKLGKYIAVTCNKEKEFRNKWKFFCLYKLVLYFDLFLFVTYLFNNLFNSRKLFPYTDCK